MSTSTILRRTRPRARTLAAWLAFLLAAAAFAVAVPALAVQYPQAGIVSDDPAGLTPHATNGRVYSIAVAPSQTVVGGTFTTIAQNEGGPTTQQRGVFAFDRATGVISSSFRPVVDGEVRAVVMDPDGQHVYIGGNFQTVNGITRSRVARLRLSDGSLDTGFQVAPNGRVQDMVLRDGRLWVGGDFSWVDGFRQPVLMALDPATGDVDRAMTAEFADPWGGNVTSVQKIDVTPDGTRLVAIGNFGTIDGQDRDHIALFDVGASSIALSDWQTSRYFQGACASVFDSYMRDVDISPDGSYMVVVTTGAYRQGRLCDTAARWDLSATGTALEPSWVNYTGGDTLYGVGITGAVVYIGGHQRWVNNPFAGDRAGPGAISREGIAALDPRNGLPFQWNPGRTRGVGVFDIVSAPEGVYMGSDTDRWGAYEYHGRLALFPSVPGAPYAEPAPGQLPGTLVRLPSGTGTPPVVSTAFDGATTGQATPVPTDVQFGQARGAFMLGDRVYTGWNDGQVYRRSFDGATFGAPTAIDQHGLTSSQFAVASLTGMTYDPTTARLYYTLSGNSTLYYRYFLPESDTIGAQQFVASGSTTAVSWSTVRGLHLDPTTRRLYYGSTSGELRSIAFPGPGPTGTSTLHGGPAVDGTSWSATGLFALSGPGSVLPNQDPTASLSATCEGQTCTFGSTGSSDPDGTIASYDWDFGDGGTATGPSTEHTFGDGTFEVTLTVTDDDGATGEASTTLDLRLPPTVVTTTSCASLSCRFDASASTDDAPLADVSWNFGDTTTGNGAVVEHTFGAPGDYVVTVTVTGADGLSATSTESVSVVETPDAITFLDAVGVTGNRTQFPVTVPDEVVGGDLLVIFGSFNRDEVGQQPPTGVTGWDLAETRTSGSMRSTLWTKVADGTEAGATVTLPVSGFSKGDVTLAVYRGTSTTQPVLDLASASEIVNRTSHTTPVLTNGLDGVRTLSYWADESNGTTSWSLPGEQVVRRAGYGAGSGRIGTVLADTGAASPLGTTGGVTATSNSSTLRATMWTVLLAPADFDTGDPVPPVAAVTSSCDGLACTFDGSGSTDADGTVDDWVWDLGDGTTATGPTASRTYDAEGARQVVLTVTDDDGLTDQATVDLDLAVPPVADIALSCAQQTCTFDGAGSTDTSGGVVEWAWDLGDGNTEQGTPIEHTFAQSGTYTVVLTVTDDEGQTASTSVDVTLGDATSQVTFVGASATEGNSTSHGVGVPPGTAAGDTMLLFVTVNQSDIDVAAPTGLDGWALADEVTSSSMRTRLYTRMATATDAGGSVSLSYPRYVKAGVVLSTWTGTDPAAAVRAVAAAGETTSRADHTTPVVAGAQAGDLVIQYWADKSSFTDSWSAPAGTTELNQLAGTGGGHISSLLAELGPLGSSGPVGGLTATADSSNNKATMWTVVLAPRP